MLSFTINNMILMFKNDFSKYLLCKFEWESLFASKQNHKNAEIYDW